MGLTLQGLPPGDDPYALSSVAAFMKLDVRSKYARLLLQGLSLIAKRRLTSLGVNQDPKTIAFLGFLPLRGIAFNGAASESYLTAVYSKPASPHALPRHIPRVAVPGDAPGYQPAERAARLS